MIAARRPAALCLTVGLLVSACAGPGPTPTPLPAASTPTSRDPATATTPRAIASMSPGQRTVAPTAAVWPPPIATLPPPAAGTPPPDATAPALPTEPTEPVPVDPALGPPLQEMLDEWLAHDGAPGAVLGVRLADGRTAVVSAGETDVGTGRPVDPGHRFRIGSITKTIVAALIVQLADDGRLALDDAVASHLPEAPHAAEVTVRQLLDHTSGMPDFAAQPSYRSALLGAPGREWEPEDVLNLIAGQDLEFQPGTDWAYSNTNYTLLGMLAEAVAGDDLPRLLRQRIFEPLELNSTYLEGLEPAPGLAVSGHFDIDGDGAPDNVRAIPYTALVTSGAAAGGVSASALDVLDFASALFGRAVVSDAGLAEMTALVPPSTAYGAGLALFRLAGRDAWGHSGALPGFSALLVHWPADGLTIVAIANETGSAVAALVERAAALAAGR